MLSFDLAREHLGLWGLCGNWTGDFQRISSSSIVSLAFLKWQEVGLAATPCNTTVSLHGKRMLARLLLHGPWSVFSKRLAGHGNAPGFMRPLLLMEMKSFSMLSVQMFSFSFWMFSILASPPNHATEFVLCCRAPAYSSRLQRRRRFQPWRWWQGHHCSSRWACPPSPASDLVPSW